MATAAVARSQPSIPTSTATSSSTDRIRTDRIRVDRISADGTSAERPRELGGWRQGRPVEDPEKTKTWGFVSAKPSEFLVHVRRGNVRQRSSGQGATCFKWPWDAVAVVPTSLQRLSFVADQVTLEKVGVAVTGLAVYRIADPLLAFRVLNFSYPERAQEKLEETLTDMFIGAARRIIAGLTVEDCLQKRKEALGHELLREIAPVVGGRGRPDDAASEGWGVVIDTIEIQEVRVMSPAVFAAMQAPYRAGIERAAREAKAIADLQIAARETECNRTSEESRIAAELALQQARAQLRENESRGRRDDELRAIEAAQAVALAELQRDADHRAREAELARSAAERDSADAVYLQELFVRRAHAELAAYETRASLERQQRQLAAEGLAAALTARRDEAEVELLEGRNAADVQLAEAEAERASAEARAKLLLAERLPDLAAAVGNRIGEVKVTQIGGDQNPFAQITQAVGAVLEMVR